MNRLIFLLSSIIFSFFTSTLYGQENRIEIPEHISRETVTYAIKENDTLKMDIYRLKAHIGQIQPVMMFQFGGSFMRGNRDRPAYGDYFTALAESGFTVVSIDYRLGMKDKKYNLGAFTAKEGGLSDAVQLAVEDLFSATDYLIGQAGRWRIDPDSILASGSSAGAISVLQADWIVKNRMKGVELLPDGFTYKGIIGFAGGIFSRTGGPRWEYGNPAPTLMFHGSKDRTVPYRTLRFLNLGMFPSKNLERRMRRAGNNYIFVDLQRKDHEYGAVTAMSEGLLFVKWFLDEYIRSDRGRQVAFDISDGF